MSTATTESHGTSGHSLSITTLIKVVVYKQIILQIRYPVNTLAQFLTLFIMFAVIFFGGQAVAGPEFSDSLEGIIIGFFLFTLAIISYSALAYDITREAQWGTLERLFLSPYGFGVVVSIKTIVNVAVAFLYGVVFLLMMMIVSGRWLAFDVFTVLPLAVLTLASVVGIGFVFAGISLLYKRLENLLQIIQFGFIGLIASPVEQVWALKLMPLSHGSYLIGITMKQGKPLWEFPPSEIGLLVATSITYLILGYYFFYKATTEARKRGVMGHY